MERDVINTCNFFEAIMGNSRENSFIILDAQGTIVDCNKGVFNAYGYLPEDLSGRHFSVLFTDQDREDGKPQRELKKALLEGSASDYNYLKHKDGRLIWTQGETILAAGNNGSSFFVKSIVDINRQKDLEKYLEESELNEVILESIQDPLVAVDRNMRIVKANSAFYEVFCIDPKDSKAVDFFNAINNLQGNVAELKELFDKNLPESFSVEDVEAEYNFPSKGKRILSILISKINFGAESLKRIIVYFKDITRERQEKEELQNKIKFSQAIIEALPQIAWTSGLDNTVNYFNKRWEEYTGQSLEDGKGKGWVKMVHPEDVSKAIAIYKGNKAENREAEAEIRLYYAKEKIFRWNIVRVRQVMKDYGGAPLYVGVTTDIHHEKMAYSKIQDILLDSQVLGKIGSYELDFLNDKITWTPQTYKIYGFKPDQEVTIEEILSRIHPKDREIFQKTIQDSIENGTSYEMEYDLLFPDKSGKKLLSRGKVYNGDDGKPARLVGTLIDITNRKEREEKLENMQTLLLESQALSHTGSFEWDLLTNHVHWTPELYAICGIPPTERITFETHTRYIHPEDLQGVLRQFDEAYINPGPFKNEFRIVRTDNSQRYVSSEAIVICDDNNKPAKVLGTLHDLTERRKIEEELSEANQELEKKVKERTLELLKINEELKKANADSNTFVYTASHDLKAPISNIEGLIRALQEEVNLNENLTTIFDMLHAAIDNFKHNLQDLAAIGKAQAEGNLKESSVSFEDVFHAVHTDLQENIMQSRAEINYDFSKAPEIKMASKNLRSIFYNTISNAIKYKHPDRPPVIHIYSEDFDDDHFLLSIQDNGMGIKEEDKEKLFILYTRIHEHVQGTGVGLAIVKRIIENHGGWIEVESEPGKGATFNIYIKK